MYPRNLIKMYTNPKRLLQHINKTSLIYLLMCPKVKIKWSYLFEDKLSKVPSTTKNNIREKHVYLYQNHNQHIS